MSSFSQTFNETVKMVTTRKDHICAGCGKKCPIGSRMYASSFLGDDGYATWHVCRICEEVSKRIECADCDGAWDEGFAYEPDPEFWENVRKEQET